MNCRGWKIAGRLKGLSKKYDFAEKCERFDFV